MKRLTLIFLLALSVSVASAQDKPKAPAVKQDSIVQMRLNDFRILMYNVDANIDSKKVSKELVDFVNKRIVIVPVAAPAQPAEKPKK